MARPPIAGRSALFLWKGLLAGFTCVLSPSAAADREPVVRLDLGCPGSTVQRGWTAWNIGSSANWEGRGPFTFRVERALFDRDGFTVTLGPRGAVGYRAGPACTGRLGAVIEEIVFGRVANPLTITLSGLAAGTYRIITWHNDSRGYEPLPVDVVVSDATHGEEAVIEAHMQTGLRDSVRASQADFLVTSDGENDLVIRFLIDGAPNEHTALNGLEIMGGEALHRAFRPGPGQGEEEVLPEAQLTWRTGVDAVRHDVYLGTSREELTLAATTKAISCEPGNLRWGQVYFWRVDESGRDGKHEGRVWSFTTADGRAHSPAPSDGAEAVSRHPTLAWQPSHPDARHNVYLGAAPDRLARVAQRHPMPTFAARDLALGQTYCWRVDEVYETQTVEGLLWRFTVDAGAARHPVPADREGYVPADIMLRWQPGDPEATHNVYLAAGPDRLDAVATGQKDATYAPRDLVLGKTYYWRVDQVYDGGTVTSPVWSFTVGNWSTASRAVAEGVPSRRRNIVDIAGAWTGGYEQNAAPDMEPVLLSTDVCIVGGGSGGIGAALAAARAGINVLVIEREDKLGGTSTQAYVNSWEPGPGCSIARELYERLCALPGAVTQKAPYDQTLTRAGMKSVQFEVAPFCQVVNDMLDETGRCRVLLETSFVEAETHVDGGRVWSIKAAAKNGRVFRVRAKVFIDCTGGAYLCQAAGCEVMLGEDPKSRFGEPSAPEHPKERLNALILGYRIRKSDNPVVQAPPDSPLTCQGGYAFTVPSGDMLVNPCGGMMAGWELIDRGYEGALAECKRRVQAHWHWLQKTQYPNYEFVSYAPMLGIRESYRVVGEYVLREQDLLAGIEKQTHTDVIAIADHPMDTHGSGGGLAKVAAPYGIPYRCLIPRGGWTNLLVACRGASFSHLAASSCRLSRTMIQLGHAAGLAAAQAVKANCGVGEIDVSAIQRELRVPERGGR